MLADRGTLHILVVSVCPTNKKKHISRKSIRYTERKQLYFGVTKTYITCNELFFTL
jgi:hypothetical protein